MLSTEFVAQKLTSAVLSATSDGQTVETVVIKFDDDYRPGDLTRAKLILAHKYGEDAVTRTNRYN